jgi:Protein of unknown function (DUF3631)
MPTNLHDLPTADDAIDLLDDIEVAVRRYCVLPSEHAYVAVVLWATTTHVLNSFDYAARLVARSAEKRSGKSRLGEVLAGVVHDPLRTVNASVAYIFRSLDKTKPPTILLDEGDAIFGTKVKAEQNEDLRGLLNAGHQRGLTYGRTVGPMHVPTEFPTFSMAFVAGIGRMPDTIEDRAVVLRMRRRKRDEPIQPFRQRRDNPPLFSLRDRLMVWAATVEDQLDGADPRMPAGVEDRAADTWEPLLAVADQVGGHWPDRARVACLAMVADADMDEAEQSDGLILLADIKDRFECMTVSFMKSEILCHELCQMTESPWRDIELNPSKLGHRLSEYGIRSGRNTTGKERGYRRENFLDAWSRYLPEDDDDTDPAPKASEGVRRRPQAADLHKRSDAFGASDALKVSDDFKASDDNRRSEHVLTPSDAFGHHEPAKSPCSLCKRPSDRPGGGLCQPCYDRTSAAS